jgi:hypothetical protein
MDIDFRLGEFVIAAPEPEHRGRFRPEYSNDTSIPA